MRARYRFSRMVTVCTVLPPPERPRLDAVGDGCFTTLHASSSETRCGPPGASGWTRSSLGPRVPRRRAAGGRALRCASFPLSPAVALVSRHDRGATETLLRLGATGVRSAVDCTEPAGWRRLRTWSDIRRRRSRPAFSPASSPRSRRGRVTCGRSSRRWPDSRRCSPTVRRLARHLRICSSTSCPVLSGGPAVPETYLAGMRLVHAAYLFSNPGSRSPTWRTASTIRHPRALGAT